VVLAVPGFSPGVRPFLPLYPSVRFLPFLPSPPPPAARSPGVFRWGQDRNVFVCVIVVFGLDGVSSFRPMYWEVAGLASSVRQVSGAYPEVGG